MLSQEEWEYLFKLVRDTLKLAVTQKAEIKFSPPEPKERYSHLYERRGVFVTLLKEGYLRGCMGSLFSEKPLFDEIVEVALSSAFKDPRFPPINEEELPLIEIEISLLSPLKKSNWEEVEVGKHGIYLKKGFYRGLLLPQVATHYNWDKKTFLKHTCLKAGLPEDCYLDPEVEIYTFTAEVAKEKEKIV